MNKKPVSYLQTDSRWRYKDYSTKGESTTIGASGCGPTAAAMLIETLTGKTYTPVDACAWSLSHGYKALKSGTYYGYFTPQFKAFGIDCKQLNSATVYGNSKAAVHATAFDLLKQGYYLIACMGKGTWTSSGHYIVVWWEDGLVRINDPASTKSIRLNGDLATFKSQVKFYWAIDARNYNNAPVKKEEPPKPVEKPVTDEEFLALFDRYKASVADNEPSDYSLASRDWATEKGLIKGTGLDSKGNPVYMWDSFLTREQFVTVLYRLYNEIKKG